MDKFPIFWKENSVGELTVDYQPPYTCFQAHCSLPEKGIWCVWAVGKQNELRLGLLEQGDVGNLAVMKRRFSNRMTDSIGSILRGEIRSINRGKEDGWILVTALERHIHTLWICRQLHRYSGVLIRNENGGKHLAIPYDKKRPFPLIPLFCFARVFEIRGTLYAVFSFDEKEQPIF